MKKLALIPILLSTQTFAMFCPTNFNEISVGNSVNDVVKYCGAPDEKQTSVGTANLPQEWSYYVDPSRNVQTGVAQRPTSSLKMTIAIVEDKVANITVNGQSLITTPVCGGPIKIGDSMERIKAACGGPSFIAKGQPQPGEQTKETKITKFIYRKVSPPITLIFENDVLKERK